MIGACPGSKSVNVRDVAANEFIEHLSKFFETNRLLEAPKWADLVKTGHHKQMPPSLLNWWYTRAAAVARTVYLHPGTSVQYLRNKFGGSKNYGAAPRHFAQSSGKIVRTMLQQLEKIDYVKKDDKGGRVITSKGQKQLDLVAKEVAKSHQ